MRTPTLVIFVCLIPWQASALNYPAGDATTCATCLQEPSKLDSNIHHGGPMPTATNIPGEWLIGFLEGQSWACMQHKPLTRGLDSLAVFERVDKICKANTGPTPLRLVAAGLITVLDPEAAGICPPSDAGYAHTAPSR